MDKARALEIIKTLANGVDPDTGEVLLECSPFNSPDVIRALHVAVEELRVADTSQAEGRAKAANAGRTWSPEDDSRLSLEFASQPYSNARLTALANQFARSRGAIRARLIKLGHIASD